MTRLLPLSRNPDLVTLVVQVDGEELPRTVPVRSLEVVSQVNRIPFARLRVSDGDPATEDFPVSAGDLFLPGREVRVLAGYHGETEPVFTGLVTVQRAVVRRDDSWLEVECRAPAFKMTLGRRHRLFEEVSDSDVAATLVAEHGLSGDFAATDVVHPSLVQFDASDWDFLVARLEAQGQLVVADGDTVRSYRPDVDGEPEAEVLYGATLLELDAQLDTRAASGTVLARAWDAAGQELLETEAVDPAWGGGGDLGPDELSDASGREEDVLHHGGSLAADALQAWADGCLLRSRMAATRGRARFQGLSRVVPGSILSLAGLGLRFNGKAHVCGVRHEMAEGDWTTDVELGLDRRCHAERFAISQLPASGLAPGVEGLQLGVVTQLADDPAGESRVRVQVPVAVAGSDLEGVWARVATLDAGDGRGTFFRPEVGDEVVLGFLHADPGQPVILGMLHSSAKPPPEEPSEDNHTKAYVSASGLRLAFDDEGSVVTLETPAGAALVLSDDDGAVSLADANGNRIVLDADGIRLESAGEVAVSAATDLKLEGLNLQLAASAELKAEGTAAAEVSSSGTMTIKGALVQIN